LSKQLSRTGNLALLASLGWVSPFVVAMKQKYDFLAMEGAKQS